jgi:hypothetical protein
LPAQLIQALSHGCSVEPGFVDFAVKVGSFPNLQEDLHRQLLSAGVVPHHPRDSAGHLLIMGSEKRLEIERS